MQQTRALDGVRHRFEKRPRMIQDTCSDQETALGNKAVDMESMPSGGEGNSSEIHMRGQILFAGLRQQLPRLIESPMPVVGTQGARCTPRVVALRLPVSIVDQQHRCTIGRLCKARHPWRDPRADLTPVSGRPLQPARAGRIAADKHLGRQRGISRLTRPDEVIALHTDTPLQNIVTARPLETAHRHGIEHLIGQHQSAKARHQMIRPAQASRAPRHQMRHRLTLQLAQIRTQFDHLDIRRNSLALRKVDQSGRKIAPATPEFTDAPGLVGAAQWRRPIVNRPRKPWPEHGCGDEVPTITKRCSAPRVVTESGGVERRLHEAIETDPATGLRDHAGDMCRECGHGVQVIKATLRPMLQSPTHSPSVAGPGQPPPGAALVTGAAVRLGREIALRMAADGWDLALHYRRSEAQAQALADEVKALGRQCACVKADLGQPAEIAAMFEQALAALPHLNCIVNNASRFEFDRPEDVQADALLAHYRDNLVGPVMLGRMLFERLSPRHRKGEDPLGVIIHILDQKLANPNPDFFSYTLSKASLLEATRLCAQAYAPTLRVLAVAPGITLPSGDQTADEFALTHGMTPLGASSRPREVADAVTWLARARAVTGTMLLVDGGQHMAAQPRDIMMMVRS
jgi:NAD(P)-dependent dehydrogenase (short-subunit alcohol dehydrogenase family)